MQKIPKAYLRHTPEAPLNQHEQRTLAKLTGLGAGSEDRLSLSQVVSLLENHYQSVSAAAHSRRAGRREMLPTGSELYFQHALLEGIRTLPLAMEQAGVSLSGGGGVSEAERTGPEELASLSLAHQLRQQHIWRFGFAAVTAGNLRELRQSLSRKGAIPEIIEVDAGNGQLTRELQLHCLPARAFESYAPGTPEHPYKGVISQRAHCEITLKNARATVVEECQGREDKALLCSWPDYRSEHTADMLEEHAEQARRRRTRPCFIYIGEPAGGCTGPARFHQVLKERYTLETVIEIPQFPFIHDRMEVHRVSRQ